MVLCQAFLSLLPPPPSPIKNLVSPIPLGRPDTQAKMGYSYITYDTHENGVCLCVAERIVGWLLKTSQTGRLKSVKF